MNINIKSGIRTVVTGANGNSNVTHKLVLKDKMPAIEILKKNFRKENSLCTIRYVAQEGTESRITNKAQRTVTTVKSFKSTYPMERRLNGIGVGVINGGEKAHEIYINKIKINNKGKSRTTKMFSAIRLPDCVYRHITFFSHGRTTKSFKEIVSQHKTLEHGKTTIVERNLRLENPFRLPNRTSGILGNVKVTDENGKLLVNHYSGVMSRIIPAEEKLPPEIEYMLQKGANNEYIV